MLLISDAMKSMLHAELDKALEIIDRKLDACCGVAPDCVELELKYRRGLGRKETYVDYFVTVEVSLDGAVESNCSGQTLFIEGQKYEI